MVHGNPGDIFKILSTHKAELPTEIDVQENDLVCLIEATGAQSMKIYPRNTEFASVKHDHHSLACHLNPHLSESNLGFHDIHQITDTKMMRKRNVVTSKMIKIHSLKNSKKEDIKKAVIKVSIYDTLTTYKGPAETVSNICSINMNEKSPSDGTNTIFSNKVSHTILIRSNYNLPRFILNIAVYVPDTSNGLHFGELQYVGSVFMKILETDKSNVLISKSYSEVLKNMISPACEDSDFHLKFTICDPTDDQRLYIDLLPDVLICFAHHVRMYSIFRQIAFNQLVTDRISDTDCVIENGFLTHFLKVVDNIPLMNYFNQKCTENNLYHFRENDTKCVEQFIKIFYQYIFPIGSVKTLEPEYCFSSTSIRDAGPLEHLQKRKIYLFDEIYKKDPIAFLASQQTKPINAKDFVYNLCNIHAID